MSECLIRLTNGEFAKCDMADRALLERYRWSPNRCGRTTYAIAHSTGSHKTRKGLKMHRLILNPADGVYVDHINGDGLDNRRCNLRLATKAQNARNSTFKRAGSSSKFKGVCFRSDTGKWRAYVRSEGKKKFLGQFESEVEAAAAYNAAALKEYGEYARINNI